MSTNNNPLPIRTLTSMLGLALCTATAGCDEDPWQDGRDQVEDEDRGGPVTQFSKVFVIGDSLSDTSRMGSGLIPYCPNSKRGYWNRRFSNGFLWIDYLMQDNPGLAHRVKNYAVGGSGVLHRYGSGIIGRTEKQAQDLVSQNSASDVSNSMVIVWAGSNDIKEVKKVGDSVAYANSVFSRLRDNTIEYLVDRGVDDFVLVGLPPIQDIPLGRTWSAGDRGWVATAINQFNLRLKNYAALNGYVYLDVADKIGQVLDGTITSVNMTDLHEPCHDGPNCVEQGDIPGHYQDQRCVGKMFFDRVHPTTGAHCGIAKWMEQAMSSRYDIDGGGESLESCARRVQTATASWGAAPTNHTEPRPKEFRVATPRNPSQLTCLARCDAVGAQPTGERGNIQLPNGWFGDGYCTCKGSTGPDDFCETYDGESVTLRTYHDTYVRAGNGGEDYRVNQTTVRGPWERFTVDCNLFGTKAAFKTAHGRYIRAFPDGSVAQQGFVGTQEAFTPVYQAEGSWAFETSEGKYLKAANNNRMMQQTYMAEWEKFIVER